MILGFGRSGPPLLRVTLDSLEIASFNRRRERTPSVPLNGPRPELVFHDSKGGKTAFDLSSLAAEEFAWIHFSIRVGPTFGVQSDALLSSTADPPLESFANHETPGVRLQPFLLPESGEGNGQFQGKGMAARGLHYPGTITPGNVSLLCLCDVCRRTFRLQSFHAGFSGLVYFYCSGGPHTLVMSGYEPDAPPLLQEADPAMLERLHPRLPPCSRCGGSFRHFNPLRCPHCNAPYIDFERFPGERAAEYYGNVVYGETAQQLPE